MESLDITILNEVLRVFHHWLLCSHRLSVIQRHSLIVNIPLIRILKFDVDHFAESPENSLLAVDSETSKRSIASLIDSFGDVETALGAIKDGQSIDSFADVETAISGIKDGTTIDSFADVESAIGAIEDGTTIDSFADVESALALKQDATDSNLQTTADTIVGAINENASDIGSLKSGLTNLVKVYHATGTTDSVGDFTFSVPSNGTLIYVRPLRDEEYYNSWWGVVLASTGNNVGHSAKAIKDNNTALASQAIKYDVYYI